MNRGQKFAMAGALVAVLGTAYGSAAAFSDNASGAGSSNSRAAQSTSGTITTHVTNGGLLSGVLTTLTTNVATPLANLPGTLVTGLATGITDSGLSATNPSNSQPRPSSTYSFPTCGQQGWTNPGDCYGPTVPNVTTNALSLSVGSTQGYATGDSAGYIAATKTADPTITLLGVLIGDLGLVESSASCTAASVCSTDQKLSNGSLFNGALTYSLVNGQVVAKVGAVTVGSTPVTVTSAVKATVTAATGLTLTITLSTTQLLGAIGQTLATLGTLLGDTVLDNSTTATLTVTIGPGSTTTAGSSATAWGLDVNATLTADVKLKILTLLGISLGTYEVTASGQLVDLKLAYSNATAGSVPAQWIPPALI
jgi:hypothetical protein